MDCFSFFFVVVFVVAVIVRFPFGCYARQTTIAPSDAEAGQAIAITLIILCAIKIISEIYLAKLIQSNCLTLLVLPATNKRIDFWIGCNNISP